MHVFTFSYAACGVLIGKGYIWDPPSSPTIEASLRHPSGQVTALCVLPLALHCPPGEAKYLLGLQTEA